MKVIKFPVLISSEEDPMCYVFKDIRVFQVTNTHGFSNGVFNNMIVFDSCGYIHDSYGSEIVGWGAPLWGYLTLNKGRQVKVKMKYTTRPEPITLHAFKEMILNKVRNAKGRARQFYLAKMPIDEYVKAINDSKSYAEVISVVA